MAVMGECADYSAILRRNPSTSSRMFKEKNLGNSVDDGVRDNGGMCCKAFLGEKTTQKSPQNQNDGQITALIHIPHFFFYICKTMSGASYCVL